MHKKCSLQNWQCYMLEFKNAKEIANKMPGKEHP